MPGFEPRRQHLFHKGEKDIAVGGRLDGHAGEHACGGQRGQHRQRAPVAGGNRFRNPFRSRRPTIAARHFRGDAAFVEKHQTSGIQFAYLFPPRLAAPEVLPAVLFLRPERFFLCRKPSRCSHTHKRDRLRLTPARSASRCCSSAKVKSGCCRSADRNCCSTAGVNRLAGPWRSCWGRSFRPVRSCWARIFLLYPQLTRNCFANSCKLPWPASYASRSLQRKSSEYARGIVGCEDRRPQCTALNPLGYNY